MHSSGEWSSPARSTVSQMTFAGLSLRETCFAGRFFTLPVSTEAEEVDSTGSGSTFVCAPPCCAFCCSRPSKKEMPSLSGLCTPSTPSSRGSIRMSMAPTAWLLPMNLCSVVFGSPNLSAACLTETFFPASRSSSIHVIALRSTSVFSVVTPTFH
eukprot:CAMPEP_0198726936 /NCGR_PEP_ID=MMETSP1475-20131203/3827_1 /TAXON_ID= ORGANISM="Unidentified sp., Strain CCMP1999" /NCGR_SAMPLE_ID=MMETSP1475 /ASSEMBLY_ACC=CAM_ASM_001111 /LENGTH=154 /DNA_ID=CAMNT_0044488913 /DNA_START=309 /DNA_END=770 /DNA_ORIENTATION=-